MNDLCALLFVYCGLPVIKIKSAEGISLGRVPSLSVFFSLSPSHSLGWLSNPSSHLDRHTHRWPELKLIAD